MEALPYVFSSPKMRKLGYDRDQATKRGSRLHNGL